MSDDGDSDLARFGGAGGGLFAFFLVVVCGLVDGVFGIRVFRPRFFRLEFFGCYMLRNLRQGRFLSASVSGGGALAAIGSGSGGGFGGRQFGRGAKDFQQGVEEIVDAVSVFGGNGKQLVDAETVKLGGDRRLLGGIDFVDGEEERLAGAVQQARQFHVGGGEFGAAVDHHHNGGGFVEGDARLAENLRWDEFFVFGD